MPDRAAFCSAKGGSAAARRGGLLAVRREAVVAGRATAMADTRKAGIVKCKAASKGKPTADFSFH